MSGFNSYSEIPYFFIISFNLTNFVPAGFSHTEIKIREKFIAKPGLNLIGFGAVKDRGIVDLLFAAPPAIFCSFLTKGFPAKQRSPWSVE